MQVQKHSQVFTCNLCSSGVDLLLGGLLLRRRGVANAASGNTRLKKCRNVAFVLIMIVISWLHAPAKDIFIAQSATGSENGTSCSSAYSLAWLNTSSNWGTGATQVGPGDVVHLCGPITSPITFYGSGTNAAPITLYFESGASMQQPVWSTPAITLNGQSWIVVDGGNGGRIFSTNSGTGQNAGDSICIKTDAGAANVTIQNVECGPMYLRTSSGDSHQVGSGICCSSGNHLTIRNSVFHDAYYCIDAGGSNVSDITIYGNNIYNCSTGIVVGDGGSGTTVSNVQIYGNHIHDGANWDGCWNGCSVWNHNDGIHVWTSSGGTQNAPKIYGNTIDGNWGAHTTAFIFMEADEGPMPSPMVYNNLLNNTGPDSPTNGLVEMKENITSGQLYNNTFACEAAGGNGVHWEGGSSSKAINNVFLNCGTAFANDDGAGSMSHDYTAYWKTPAQSDAHMTTANPLLSVTLVPLPCSPLIGHGENLSALFTTDLAGAARPSSGAWTLGAYEVAPGSGAGCGNKPAPPPTLKATPK